MSICKKTTRLTAKTGKLDRRLQTDYLYSIITLAFFTVDDLRNAIQDLAINGTRRPLEDALHSGLRRTRSGRHLVFYLIDANTVDVVRVLHERMDAQLQL